MVFRAAFWALAFDKAVGQEHFLDRIVELLNRAGLNQTRITQARVNGLAMRLVLGRVGGIVVVKAHMKTGEVALMFGAYPCNQLLRADAFGLGTQHDWRAVGVVGAHVVHLVALHFLKANPDVGLNVFDQVAQVNGAVGIGQGGGNKNSASHDVVL